jgi:hypothetical protein
MADYNKNDKGKLEPLNPQEALEYLEKKKQEKTSAAPVQSNVEPEDRAAKEAKLLGSTKEAIQLRKAEINGEIKLLRSRLTGEINTIKASETAKERAGKHLAVFGALYLCTCTIAFLFSMSVLDTDSIAVAATLVTLVVTQLSSILKTVVDTREPKDPVELMSDVAHKAMGNDKITGE